MERHWMDNEFICVELSRDCNNACSYCYNYWRGSSISEHRSEDALLTRSEIRDLVSKVQRETSLKYVTLTGGEPLLRKDFPDILRDMIDLGLSPIVITNGVLLTESLLRKLPKGVVFEITLLGPNAEIHDRIAGRKVFTDVVVNASRIVNYGSSFVGVFVATKQNALHVYGAVELAIALGCSAVMYNRVNISASMKGSVDAVVPSRVELAESLRLFNDALTKYDMSGVCSVPVMPCLVDISLYPRISFGWCPRGGKHAYYTVGYNGLLRPCNHSSFVLGDLKKEGFAEIISRDATESFWNFMPDECQQCEHPLKESCLGGCPAASYEYYGMNQNRPDPYMLLS